MRGLGHRVQLVLLFATVFVPCAVLIGLSLRVADQDRELRVRRQGDERSRVLAEAARKLSAVLDRIKNSEIRTELNPAEQYLNHETVFVGWSEGTQLVLPWEPERNAGARRSREVVDEPQFSSAMRACDTPSVLASIAQIETCYRRAKAAARDPVQKAYAVWQFAEALAGAGQSERAAALVRPLLYTGPEYTDAEGIPFKLHASRVLLQTGEAPRQIVAALQMELDARPWFSPLSLLSLSDAGQLLARRARSVDEKRAAEALHGKIAAQMHLIDVDQALESEFPRLRAALGGAWLPYGEDLWLVGAAGDLDGGATIFVVRGPEAFRAADIPGAQALADSRSPAGEPLGNRFPGLKLVMAASNQLSPEPGGGTQRQILFMALLVAVLVTVFAAYLLWRDLQREMRLSELRAQFVSSVSHELKTPLTAIRMFAETLQMGRCTDAEVQAEYLGTIVNECERLSRLVDGVLLFSKAEQGQRKAYHFRFVQPAKAVDAAVRAIDYPLSQHGFHLRVEIEDDLPQIPGDEDAIEQAVLNLLSNAMKFSGDSREIELKASRDEDEITIRVTDHGIGIAPEDQARIFDKFYRAATRENQLIPGTGLGLTLVRQIAGAHGGRITVESAPGKGSTFCLRLPARSKVSINKGKRYEHDSCN